MKSEKDTQPDKVRTRTEKQTAETDSKVLRNSCIADFMGVRKEL